ncbi:hypothetical protein CTI14_43590, partial [Methylobacterium radiotolerans]
EDALNALEAELREEIESITLFPDAAPTLLALKARGIKVALCSNLAAPYGPPVLDLLPFQPDFCAWSYEAGAVKPQPEIYQYLCDGIACQPEEVLMIGDTIEAEDALNALEAELREEIESITLFPDAAPTLLALKA